MGEILTVIDPAFHSDGWVTFCVKILSTDLTIQGIRAKETGGGGYYVLWPGGRTVSKELNTEVAQALVTARRERFGPEKFPWGRHRMVTRNRVTTRGGGKRRK